MRCGHLCFLFCIVMSSTIDVVLKLTSFQIDPFQMAFWRFLLGGLFCLPVALHEMKKQGLGFSPSFLLPLSLSGFLCVVLSTGFHQTAIASGKASVVSVLYCCSPLFVTAAARCMLKERISKSVMLSCALYLTSMAVILANQAERTSILSCVFTLLASVLFAVYNVLGQRWVGRFPPVVYVTFSFLFGSMELLAVIGLSHQRTFAELARANGLELLVDCAERLKDQPNIRFLVYGAGDDVERLRAACRERNIDNLVFKGPVDKAYIPYILSKSDLNVLNYNPDSTVIYRFGSSQNKLFEYLASGKPILSTVKIAYSILEKYNCGIEAEEPTADGVARGILKLYRMTPQQRMQIQENCRAAAEYDFKRLTQKLMDVIEGRRE